MNYCILLLGVLICAATIETNIEEHHQPKHLTTTQFTTLLLGIRVKKLESVYHRDTCAFMVFGGSIQNSYGIESV